MSRLLLRVMLAILPNVKRYKQHPDDYATKASWASLVLGVVELKAGVQSATVRALAKPGSQVMELGALRLHRVADQTSPTAASTKAAP